LNKNKSKASMKKPSPAAITAMLKGEW